MSARPVWARELRFPKPIQAWLGKWLPLLDWVFIPALVGWLAFEPNFPHGYIDYVETGQYLAPIGGIFRGEVPYRDHITIFGPLFLYIPAWLMLLFGKTIAVFRGYLYVTAILNILMAYIVGYLICRRRFFKYAIPFMLLVETFHPFWSTHWGGFRIGVGLLVLRFLIRYVHGGLPRNLLWAGILTGFGLLYSTEVGLYSFLAALVLAIGMFFDRLIPGRDRMRDFGAYLGGAFLVVMPFLMFYAIQGALRPYLETAFWILPLEFPKQWARKGVPLPSEFYQAVPGIIPLLTSLYFAIYIPIFLYGFFLAYLARRYWLRQVTRELTGVLLVVVYGLCLYGAAFRAIQGPQFQMALPPLIILMAFFLERYFDVFLEAVSKMSRGTRPRFFRTALSLMFLLTAGMYFLTSGKRYYQSLAGWFWYQRNKAACTSFYLGPIPLSEADLVTLKCERSGGIRVPRFQAEEMDGVTQFLLERTKPGEAVFTFPEHGIFNFLADRPGVSRFDIAGFAWTTLEWRAELLSDLKKQKPRFIVRGKPLSNLAKSIGREEELLPEVSSYIQRDYHVVRCFATVDILERREGMPR